MPPSSHIILTLTLISLLLSACGQKNLTGDTAQALTTPVIVGDVDWRAVNEMVPTNIGQNALAVADLRFRSQGSRCTGFLISKDVIMTNFHCISSAQTAAGLIAIFNHVEGVLRHQWQVYRCHHYIGSNMALDYALIRCEGNPGEKYGWPNLSTDKVSKETPVYVIQQNCDFFTDQDCDFKKIYSYGKIVGVEQGELLHDADTLGGSSGSPVFSTETNEVIALHHAGSRSPQKNGRGEHNYAFAMAEIVDSIRYNFPSIDL